MAKLDRAGIAWGILIAVMINGLYDCLILLFEGQYSILAYTALATFVVASFIAVILKKVLFPENGN